MVFLDKCGYPVECIKGRPITNFIRRLIHTRSIRRGFWNGTRVVRLLKVPTVSLDWSKLRDIKIEIVPAIDVHNLGGHNQKVYHNIYVTIRATSADGLYEHVNGYTLAKEKEQYLNVVIGNLLSSVAQAVANQDSGVTTEGAQTIRNDM